MVHSTSCIRQRITSTMDMKMPIKPVYTVFSWLLFHSTVCLKEKMVTTKGRTTSGKINWGGKNQNIKRHGLWYRARSLNVLKSRLRKWRGGSNGTHSVSLTELVSDTPLIRHRPSNFDNMIAKFTNIYKLILALCLAWQEKKPFCQPVSSLARKQTGCSS